MSIASPLRLLALLLAAGTPLSFSACADKEAASVAPAGAVKGEVYPAGAVSKVTATSATGQVYEFVPTTQAVEFQLNKLPAGDYTLVFTTTASYNTPEPKRVIIRAGQTTVVPTFTLLSTGYYTGEMTWTLNGQQYTTTLLMGEVDSDFFSVIGHLKLGTGAEYEEVALVVSGFAGMPNPFRGVGTYPLGQSQWTFGRYVQRGPNGVPATYATSYPLRPYGNVTITTLDWVGRTAAGTFSFTAPAQLNASGTRQITNGSFRFSY